MARKKKSEPGKCVVDRSRWHTTQLVLRGLKTATREDSEQLLGGCAAQTTNAATLLNSPIQTHVELAIVLGWALKRVCDLPGEPTGKVQVRLLRMFAERMKKFAEIDALEQGQTLLFIKLISSTCPTNFCKARLAASRKRLEDAERVSLAA